MPLLKLHDVFAGRYTLDELLGEGNSAEVWKAKDQLADNARVVLKIYATEHESAEQTLRQISREAALFRELANPYLLKVLHFDVAEGYAYEVMPFYPMGTLAGQLKQHKTLSEKQLALLMAQIGSALEALHQQEPPVLHQEVSPENIAIAEPDYYLLAKYGITSHAQAYASPESYGQAYQAEPSGDIFSLGVTLFALCTGTLPWNGAGGRALREGAEVPNLPKTYPAELNELLQACMSASKRARPTARELRLRGEHFLASGNWQLPAGSEEDSKQFNWSLLNKEHEEKKPAASKKTPYLLAIAAAVVLLIGAYWAYTSNFFSGGAEQETAASSKQDQDINEMLIATLEDELKDLEKQNLALKEENKQLKGTNPGNSIMAGNRDTTVEKKETPAPPPARAAAGRTEAEADNNNTKAKKVASPVAAPAKEDKSAVLQQQLEQQLNKISNSNLTAKEREALKQRIQAQFAEANTRIVDVTEGSPKQYSSSIFLNLLYKVPHTIEVKDVKTNGKQEVTELRLRMQTI